MKRILMILGFCLLYFLGSVSMAQDLKKMSYAELDSIFESLYIQGKYEYAHNYAAYGREKARQEYGEMDSTYANFTDDLAVVYVGLGRYKDAEPLHLEALSISAKILGKEHLLYMTILNNLANLYASIGRYNEAEPLNLEARKIFAKVIGKTHSDYAIILNNLAGFYHLMGHNKKAEHLFFEAIEIFVNALGENHLNYATILNNLAVLYEKMGRYELADSLYLKTLHIHGISLGKNHHKYAHSLNNLAVLYEKVGRSNEAEQLYLEALQIRKKTLGNSHFLYSWSLNNLAYLYKNKGQTQKAWEYAHEALGSMSKKNLSKNIDLVWVDKLKNLAFPSYEHVIEVEKTLACMFDLLAVENNPESRQKQILVADLAMYLLKRSRDNYFNDQDKLRLLAKSHDWMLRSLNVLDLDKNVNLAYHNVEFHKSALLMEAAMASQAYQLGDLPDSLIYKERRMKKKHAELQAKLLEKRSQNENDSLRMLLNEVNLQISAFMKQVEKDYPKYAQFQYQNHQASIIEVQKNLSQNEALIEYVIGDSMLFIIYIDQNMALIKKKDIDHSISSKINEYRKQLSNFDVLDNQTVKYSDLNELAYWFYHQLIAPLNVEIKDKKHLIFIPDGELYHLPFETFVSTAPNKHTPSFQSIRYLIQDYEVSYNFSATLWLENFKKEQSTNHNGELFALAASYEKNEHELPQVDQLIPMNVKLRSELGYLPAARQEVAGLARSFTGLFIYDSLASERTFKEKASQYGIIHLAMHGLLDEKFPTLSSLAFTDTQDSTENDFLQAYEISKMELNADLVVLSACQTGYGKFERGNGVASLARSFMYAGVPSLVVSLWQVDDLATANIMEEFYKGLTDGMSKSEALRQAKLTYIEHAPEAMKHPAYWSPFIQIGNSNPISIQRKYAFTPWYVGIITLILVCGLILLRKMRLF